MKLLFKTTFPKEKIIIYSKHIAKLIASEPFLSYRGTDQVIKILNKEEAILCFDTNILIGFIFKEKLANNFYELGALYVSPAYRRAGIGRTIFEKAINDKANNYVCYTFQPAISGFVKVYGFKVTKPWMLPVNVSCKLYRKRLSLARLKEILRHYRTSKPHLYILKAKK